MPRTPGGLLQARDAAEPVDDFIEALGDPDRQAANTRRRSRASCASFAATTGRELSRILYRRSANLFVRLHMFRKATWKLLELLRDLSDDGGSSRRNGRSPAHKTSATHSPFRAGVRTFPPAVLDCRADVRQRVHPSGARAPNRVSSPVRC
jgi:hypothetical protein